MNFYTQSKWFRCFAADVASVILSVLGMLLLVGNDVNKPSPAYILTFWGAVWALGLVATLTIVIRRSIGIIFLEGDEP